jgi:hypothetical protein
MEHNLGEYTKYYSCGNTKISRGSAFIKKLIIEEIFLDIGKKMLEINYILNSGQLFKITPKLKRYL